MYNETIFKGLKKVYIDCIKKRKNDLMLDKEASLKLIQNKYEITANCKLNDMIESYIDDLIYFDCKLEFNKNQKPKKQKNINLHQAKIFRKENKCFCNFDLKVLSHHFYLLHELNNEDILYKNILQNLTAHICCDDYFYFDEQYLNVFFNYAIDLYLLKGNIYVNNERSKVVIAIEYFNLENKKDYNIKMSHIELSEKTNKKIHQIIENKIKQLGGYKTIKIIFDKLLKKTDEKFQRYLLYRDRNATGNSNTPIPFQYIINIACKNLYDYEKSNISNKDLIIFKEIIEDSIAYVDLLEIFEENPYSEITASAESLPYLIKQNILLESLCFPIQYAPEYILVLLKNLYLKVAPKFAKVPQIYTYSSFVPFVKIILSLKPCSIINANKLSKNLRISQNNINQYLNYFSQNSDNVNIEYDEAFKKTTLYDKPLLKLNATNYFFLCPQFCGYSFLKMLYEDISENYSGSNKKNLSKKFGKEFENFVYSLFDDNNFTYKKGVYAPRTEYKGECDLILEDKNKTVFVEIKNSGIAREYEYGDDVKVLNQLGSNSLYAQSQILKHKLYLLKNNNVADLYESEEAISPTYNINTNDKKIFAVSLCGAELLFFTSGFISNHLIKALAHVNFSVKNREDGELDKINSIADEIRLLINEYTKLRRDITLNDIFFFSTVKSVQQLWFIIKQSKNIEELIDNLTFETYMQTYSCDFYINFIQHLKLK